MGAIYPSLAGTACAVCQLLLAVEEDTSGARDGRVHIRRYFPKALLEAVVEGADNYAGMVVGLIIRLMPGEYLQSLVTFDYQIFFNVLLPPIILNSGYELHQVSS